MLKVMPDFGVGRVVEEIDAKQVPTGRTGLCVQALDRFDIGIPDTYKSEQILDANGVKSGLRTVLVSEGGRIRGMRGDAILVIDGGYHVVPLTEFQRRWREKR